MVHLCIYRQGSDTHFIWRRSAISVAHTLLQVSTKNFSLWGA